MTLVFDRTDQLAGQPQTHAFLLGVSEYKHLPGMEEPADAESFGLKRLASPALSAWEVCRWLVGHADSLFRPLGSIRLLMSPAVDEVRNLTPIAAPKGVQVVNPQGIQTAAPEGTRITAAGVEHADWTSFVKEALAWREAAKSDRNGVSLFYYSGHGLERSGRPLITLADFTDPLAGGKLQRSCEVIANFVLGMAPSPGFENIARNQFYFVDACREQVLDPVGLSAQPGTVWDVLPGIDDRATPTFMASYPGSRALTIRGQPTDFCRGLIEALDKGAENVDQEDAAKRWLVDSVTLSTALDTYFERLGTGQYTPTSGSIFKRPKLCWLPEPPSVDFRVAVSPDMAVSKTEISLTNRGTGLIKRIPASTADHPYQVEMQAGIYELLAKSDGTFPDRSDFQLVNQQLPVWSVVMG
ncbi:hypothetical protein [Mesorhizobium sp. WSM3859]|uniref:hypothetical protein n=1 Tax=Mesorhizobium sp. WSM3859 TaxID=2029402 RepID=UPI0011410BBC|nr:hypothetical protein [Mesorhizobium sp. WSM3859]